MAIRTVAVLADDEPTITVETGPPVATDTQRQTRSQTRKKREELSSTLKSKPAHASLYHKMHEWQDKLDVVSVLLRMWFRCSAILGSLLTATGGGCLGL